MSVLPVCLPVRLHSVSPWRTRTTSDGASGTGWLCPVLQPVEVLLADELGQLDLVAVDRGLRLERVPRLGALRRLALVGLLLDLAFVDLHLATVLHAVELNGHVPSSVDGRVRGKLEPPPDVFEARRALPARSGTPRRPDPRATPTVRPLTFPGRPPAGRSRSCPGRRRAGPPARAARSPRSPGA